MIDTLESIQLGSTTQWIRIRGSHVSNPVLLLIQQGPGLPMINEVRRFEKTLGLERDFTVVYWDQRGCGRSLRGQGRGDSITLDLMVSDTVSLLELLRDRFDASLFVAGFSLGATIGIHTASRRPDLVEALVAVGADVDGRAAENRAYDFALSSALQCHNRRAIRQLEAIGPPPHLNAKQFGIRVRWVSNFGGVTSNETYGSVVRTLLSSMMRSSEYSLGDVQRTVRGISATQTALLPTLAVLDLVSDIPRLEVPLTMVQGRLDQVAPCEAARRYFDTVQAPSKDLVWFERSAHTPHLEEPEKFRDLLMQVRTTEVVCNGEES
jgi:pimeloyl-ACP methyl ester carboxylesterase